MKSAIIGVLLAMMLAAQHNSVHRSTNVSGGFLNPLSYGVVPITIDTSAGGAGVLVTCSERGLSFYMQNSSGLYLAPTPGTTESETGSTASFEIPTMSSKLSWYVVGYNPTNGPAAISVRADIVSTTTFGLWSGVEIFPVGFPVQISGGVLDAKASANGGGAKCQNEAVTVSVPANVFDVGGGQFSFTCNGLPAGEYSLLASVTGMTPNDEPFRRTASFPFSVRNQMLTYVSHRLDGTKSGGRWATWGLNLVLNNPTSNQIVGSLQFTIGVEGRDDSLVPITLSFIAVPGRNDYQLYLPGPNWIAYLQALALGGSGNVQIRDLTVYDSDESRPVSNAPYIISTSFATTSNFVAQ